MIAAFKKVGVTILGVMLWPLAWLAAQIGKANRKIIRWSVRRRCGPAYFIAIFWMPVLTTSGMTWALTSVHSKPDDPWPILGAALLLLNKGLAIVAYLIKQAERFPKALRYYRMHFRSEIAPSRP